MILGGLLLSYLNTFILLARPNVVICTLQRFTVGEIIFKDEAIHNIENFVIFRVQSFDATKLICLNLRHGIQYCIWSFTH